MSESRFRHLRVETISGGVAVVDLVETVELSEEVAAELDQLVEEDEISLLRINFVSIKFLFSMGLGKLIKLKKKLDARKGKLRLFNVDPEILEVFRITRLDRVFGLDGDDQPGAVAKG